MICVCISCCTPRRKNQEGDNFFSHYSFYSGNDSEGSKGYVNYVSQEHAIALGIVNITMEPLSVDSRQLQSDEVSQVAAPDPLDRERQSLTSPSPQRSPLPSQEEPFIYMSTSPTPEGPRNSVRLEGLKR